MKRMTHQVLTSDGIRVSFDLYEGLGQDTVLVICPGFFQSKDTATFQAMAKRLAESASVIAMDFRGHGRSSGLYTFSAKEGADLEAVLEWAGARYTNAGVLGFSMGARSRSIRSPARVGRSRV